MNIDIDSLKVFMIRLDDFSQQLNTQTEGIRLATEEISGKWNDEIFMEFYKNLEKNTSAIGSIISTITQYEEYLQRIYTASLGYLER
jgi:methyl-accepting chemotaxis protein